MSLMNKTTSGLINQASTGSGSVSLVIALN